MKLVANLEIERTYSDESSFSYKILRQSPYVQVIDMFNDLYDKFVQICKDSEEYDIKLVCKGYEKTLYLTNTYYLVNLIISVNTVEEVLDNPKKEAERLINAFLDDTNTSEEDYQIKL